MLISLKSEIKLQLTFTGQGEKMVKMHIRESWDYTGQQADQNDDSDDEEINLEL